LTDDWYGLSLEDIRKIEHEVIEKLQEKRLISNNQEL
jgi:hypothetical protein